MAEKNNDEVSIPGGNFVINIPKRINFSISRSKKKQLEWNIAKENLNKSANLRNIMFEELSINTAKQFWEKLKRDNPIKAKQVDRDIKDMIMNSLEIINISDFYDTQLEKRGFFKNE